MINPFLTNNLFMDKPGSWFLLSKCLKNTCGRATFKVKILVMDLLSVENTYLRSNHKCKNRKLKFH